MPREKLEAITEAYDFLEKFLEVNAFLAGESLTVADICCVATVSSLMFHPLDPWKHIKTINWIKRMKQFSFYTLNESGSEELVDFIKLYI